MSDGTVDGESGTDTDTNHHEADLVNQAIGQDSSQVILNNCVEDRESRHGPANEYQLFGPGEGSGQSVDCSLGGKCRKKNGAGDGRLGVGIGQPRVQKRPGTVNADTDKYKPRGCCPQTNQVKGR